MTSVHKSSVARHEKHVCRKNPNRETCLQCDNWFDNGIDNNGLIGSGRHEWRDAGCLKDHPVDYEARNFDIICSDFSNVNKP